MERLRVDAVDAGEARALLGACCGSSRWVEAMVARRPFGSLAALVAAGRDEWFALDPSDWLEAFAAHPKIGERASRDTRLAGTSHLAAREQSGVEGAPADVLSALAAGNAAYEEKFGFIFIVCATGRTAGQMLAMLLARLEHDVSTEIAVAAEQQAQITALRLEQL